MVYGLFGGEWILDLQSHFRFTATGMCCPNIRCSAPVVQPGRLEYRTRYTAFHTTGMRETCVLASVDDSDTDAI